MNYYDEDMRAYHENSYQRGYEDAMSDYIFEAKELSIKDEDPAEIARVKQKLTEIDRQITSLQMARKKYYQIIKKHYQGGGKFVHQTKRDVRKDRKTIKKNINQAMSNFEANELPGMIKRGNL